MTESYRRYTKKSESDKAVHLLEGILKGIAIDSAINDYEIIELGTWINQHEEFSHLYPYKDIYAMLKDILEDGIVTEDEKDDLLWFCNKVTTSSTYYDLITSDLQRLHGLVRGIIADKQITQNEIIKLQSWLFENEQLTSTYPYDEITSLITEVLKDGIVTVEEKALVERLFLEFVDTNTLANYSNEEVASIKENITLGGICALAPEINLENATVVLTGKSKKCSKLEFASIVNRLGATAVGGVSKKVNYLIVGAAGNPCWSYACYGRKIEKAIELRTQGVPIIIVHENDFWDEVDNN